VEEEKEEPAPPAPASLSQLASEDSVSAKMEEEPTTQQASSPPPPAPATLLQLASEESVSAGKMMVVERDKEEQSPPPPASLSLPAALSVTTTVPLSVASSVTTTVPLPAASSVTRVADIFSESDYDLVNIAADNLFLQFSKEPEYPALVFCLYVQALRTHFMTRKFFKSRDIYSQLNAVQSYKDHKDLFLSFVHPENNSDDIFNSIWSTPLDPRRTMCCTLQHLLGRHSIPFVQNLSLPRRVAKGNMDADLLAAFNESFQDGLIEALQRESSSSSSISERDFSVIVVDFTAIDIVKNKAAAIDFPNGMKITLEGKVYAYQTVGAIYKTHTKNGDQYSIRIISRSRCGYEYELRQIASSMSEKVPCNVSYITDWDPAIESSSSKAESFFPVEYSISLTPSGKGKKSDRWSYCIEGVILSLNEGQTEGLTSAVNISPKLQNSLSLLEPVLICCESVIRTREIKILSSEHEWLSDEIMMPAYKTFLEKGQEFGIFPKDNLVFISPPSVLWRAVLNHLKEDLDGRQDKKKASLCKMDCTIQELKEGYQHSKDLWEYKNIFSSPDSWFLSIINYPDNTHWMLVGLHVNKSSYFIYDPMADKGQRESVARALNMYIHLECESFVNWNEADDLSSHKMDDQPCQVLPSHGWTHVFCAGQNQQDKSNCGVLVLIAFFRVVNLLANKQEKALVTNWYCSIIPGAFQKYRKELLHLLTNVPEVEDPIAAVVSSSSSSAGGSSSSSSSRSSSRKREQDKVPRPREGRSFAGFRYFTEVLLPSLEKPGNTLY